MSDTLLFHHRKQKTILFDNGGRLYKAQRAHTVEGSRDLTAVKAEALSDEGSRGQ